MDQCICCVQHSDLMAEEVEGTVASFDARMREMQQPAPAPEDPEAQPDASEPIRSTPPDIISQTLYGDLAPATAKPEEQQAAAPEGGYQRPSLFCQDASCPV